MSERPEDNGGEDERWDSSDTSDTPLRRRFVQLTGVSAIVGLAGCADDEEDPDDDEDEPIDDEDDDPVDDSVDDEDDPVDDADEDDDIDDEEPVDDSADDDDDDDPVDDSVDDAEDDDDEPVDDSVDDEDDDPINDDDLDDDTDDDEVGDDQDDDPDDGEPSDDDEPVDDDDPDDDERDQDLLGVDTVPIDGRVSQIVSEIEEIIEGEESLNHVVTLTDRTPGATIVVFNLTRVDTQLVQAGWTAGVDIPHRVVVWEDDEGETSLAYTDPDHLIDRHGIEDQEAIDALHEAFDELVGQL
jgi:uncharacterized protein (DUF302 family)